LSTFHGTKIQDLRQWQTHPEADVTDRGARHESHAHAERGAKNGKKSMNSHCLVAAELRGVLFFFILWISIPPKKGKWRSSEGCVAFKLSSEPYLMDQSSSYILGLSIHVLEDDFFDGKSPQIMHRWGSIWLPSSENSQQKIKILPRLNCEEDGSLS
jgi:hypothetical protein